MKPGSPSTLALLVGGTAIVAPALHSLSDLVEWVQGGYSTAQLWLNYAAFLPMPWLLLGVYAVHDPRPRWPALAGALLYGAAFTYFSHSTLLALASRTPDYEALWAGLGTTYTVHGALMVLGGLVFGASAWRARWLPRAALGLFMAGLALNLVLALVAVPDIAQAAASAIRNAGLIAMGVAIVSGRPGGRAGRASTQGFAGPAAANASSSIRTSASRS